MTPLWGLKYKEKGKIFGPFIKEFYEKRLKAETKAANFFYKALMNSLYGRLGLNEDSNILTNIVTFAEFSELRKEEDITYWKYLSKNKILLERNEKHNFYSFGAIHLSSAIASYARIYMYNFILQNNLENDLYYMDKDSLFIKNKLKDSLVSETEIGKFKLVSTLEKGIFINQKVYYTEDSYLNKKWVIKGLKQEDTVLLTLNQIESFLLKDNKVGKLSFLRKNNFARNKYNLSINSIETLIHFDFNIYNKRTKVYKDGIWKDTQPLWYTGLPTKLEPE